MSREPPVDRRERFEPDLELRKIVIRYIEQRLQKQLESGHSRLKSVSKLIPAVPNGRAKRLRERLSALQTWHSKTRALLAPVLAVCEASDKI